MTRRKIRYRVNPFSGLIYTLFCTGTAMVGYTIHGNVFWSIVDFFFAPLAWVWWLIGQDVTISVIKETFGFFFR